jgi:tripartite-type tricarboxylate transporter receptor subunit TctC
MPLPRRQFLQLGAGALAVPMVARHALGQTYPARPLRFVVGFPAGGGADIVSRIVTQWLAERLGQPVVVENRPGASSNLSIQSVVNAPPDGHTLLFVAASAAVNMSLFDNLTFDLLRDIAPVSGLIDFPLVLESNPTLPAKTVGELIAYAKARPGELSIASFGAGSTSHVAGELFKMMAGVDMVHVPYRGGVPMLADLIGGQVQLAIDVMTGSLAHIKLGRVRPIAVLGKARSEYMPEVPAMAETVSGYEANSWCGVGVPRGTPREIVERLNREINAGLRDPALKARLANVATTPILFTPDEFGAYMAAEVTKWAKVVRAANIKPE